MRNLERSLGIIVLAAVTWIGAASFAAAAEQVSIPYRCHTAGNTVQLTPSESRRYDIYGKREQDIITACPNGDQSRCKSWRVHKFDINCAGARVPWLDIVAAANAQSGGPARAQGNKLFVRMDPWWARRDGDRFGQRPRLSEYGEADRRPSDYRYRPTGREREIEMPAGYAPMTGIRAQFVDGAPGADNGLDRGGYGEQPGPQPGPMARAEPMPSERPLAAPPAPVPAQRPAAAAEPNKPVIPPSGAKTTLRDAGHTFPPKPIDSKPEPPKTGVKVEAPKVAPSETQKSATDGASKDVATKPATDNKPETATSVATAVPAAATPAASPSPAADSTSTTPKLLNGPGAMEPPKPTGPPVITSASSSSGDSAGPNGTQIAAGPAVAIPVTIEPGPARPVTLPFVFLVGSLILLAASGAQWLWRQNRSPAAATGRRSISDVWLENSASRELVAVPDEAAPRSTVPPLVTTSAAPIDAVTVAGPVLEKTWVPSTRDEALQVLGAGPDASADVLKKIVDGLRMSWHPDHARSPEEYSARHDRMRQINVAWDILSVEGNPRPV